MLYVLYGAVMCSIIRTLISRTWQGLPILLGIVHDARPEHPTEYPETGKVGVLASKK